MSRLTVVYDACVLYPAPLRSFLMYLAMTDLFRARWSNAIHEEWMEHVERDYPDITRQQVVRIRDLMNAHVRDCLVTGFEHLIPAVSLPDPDDRHVVAAAIHCGADLIVTFNLKDFPRETLEPIEIEALHPDAFIGQLLAEAPHTVFAAAKRHRASLKNPLKSVAEYLDSLDRQKLSKSVARMRNHLELF
jgi:predicted nucleic acid-binding protein